MATEAENAVTFTSYAGVQKKFYVNKADVSPTGAQYAGGLVSIADDSATGLFNVSSPRSTVQDNAFSSGGIILTPHRRPPKTVTYTVLMRSAQDRENVGGSVKAQVRDFAGFLAGGVRHVRHGVWGGYAFCGWLADDPRVKYNANTTECFVTFTLTFTVPYVSYSWLTQGTPYDVTGVTKQEINYTSEGTYNNRVKVVKATRTGGKITVSTSVPFWSHFALVAPSGGGFSGQGALSALTIKLTVATLSVNKTIYRAHKAATQTVTANRAYWYVAPEITAVNTLSATDGALATIYENTANYMPDSYAGDLLIPPCTNVQITWDGSSGAPQADYYVIFANATI